MSTIFRARQSGGKMVRDRRMAAPKSPYDRPTPPQNHPHWLTGLVFPATRMIATGAGKLLSSVLLDTSSSSDRDSGSEDDIDNDSDDNDMIDIPPLEVEELIKKNGTSSRTAKRFRKEPHLTVEKSETKRAIEIIEPLLLQETFSREESDRLIKIINSRAVDCSNIKVGQDGRLSEIPSRTVANDIPGLCNKAVMEAKKWLEEKKEGSSSKSDLDYGTCTFNLVEQPHVTEGEVGSPADVAKSYMRARPLWESPSVSFFDIKTPLQVGIELFKEETPYSVGGNSLSTSKKRDSLATGSWNILEEIRRVRSKATEDMLRNLPSAKIDLSSFASEPKRTQISLVADVKEAAVGNKLHHSNCLATAEAIDASADLATDHVFPVLEMREDGSRNEAFSSNPATFVSEKTQDLDVIHIIGGAEDAASRSSHSIALDFASKQHTDSRSSERNCSMAKHVTELGGTPKASSSQSSGPSFSAGLGSERNPRSFDGNSMPVNSSHNKLNSSIPIEGTCELLSEASIEVPVVNEINNVASGYRNSSSLRYEELSLQLRQQNLKRSMTGKIGSMVEKQLREKKSRYIKRGQGSPL